MSRTTKQLFRWWLYRGPGFKKWRIEYRTKNEIFPPGFEIASDYSTPGVDRHPPLSRQEWLKRNLGMDLTKSLILLGIQLHPKKKPSILERQDPDYDHVQHGVYQQ